MTERGSDSENPAISAPTPEPSRPRTNRDWWPNQPDLRVLHQPAPLSSPLDDGYSYREQFKALTSRR